MSDAQPSPSEVDRPAIAVDDLFATYRVRRQYATPREGFRARLAGNGSSRLVEALRGVSFTVPQGSVLGVIGRNGAGKSTLLRAIAGILPPSDGRIVVRGRISAMLSQGVGFNRQLTGRENIELGGLAIGLTQERIGELSEMIVEFAELGEYIDFPVRSYSTGMVSRLAFAISAHLEPEILLIDEALAGGDSAFREKCEGKMDELCGRGRTIVIVSHGLRTVRTMANECLWLHQGKVMETGRPGPVIKNYIEFCGLRKPQDAFDDE